jgi:hypothetical protein
MNAYYVVKNIHHNKKYHSTIDNQLSISTKKEM